MSVEKQTSSVDNLLFHQWRLSFLALSCRKNRFDPRTQCLFSQAFLPRSLRFPCLSSQPPLDHGKHVNALRSPISRPSQNTAPTPLHRVWGPHSSYLSRLSPSFATQSWALFPSRDTACFRSPAATKTSPNFAHCVGLLSRQKCWHKQRTWRKTYGLAVSEVSAHHGGEGVFGGHRHMCALSSGGHRTTLPGYPNGYK